MGRLAYRSAERSPRHKISGSGGHRATALRYLTNEELAEWFETMERIAERRRPRAELKLLQSW